MKDQYGFSWEEFLERYLINHEEFVFNYRGIKMQFVCEGNCYPVVLDRAMNIGATFYRFD